MKIKPLSYLEINSKNAVHNVKEFKSLLKKDTKVVACIKSNAYGHGDVAMVEILNDYVDYFQVNSIEEFNRIYKFSKKPIFIFGYLNKDGIKTAILDGAIISAFDYEHLSEINSIALKLNKKATVHIAIDSFLGREGIMPNDLNKIILGIKKMKNIILEGAYSHFANIEDTTNSIHSNKQVQIFNDCIKILRNNGFPDIQTHISATSGILIHEKEENKNDLVRLGIGLYGMWPSSHLEMINRKDIILKPVLKWVTHVAQVKVLPANHTIGYGLTYVTKKKTTVAVIPAGYADGLTRSMSNNGFFLIKGKIAKILGRVSMNMTVVDVSNIKNIKSGDEVVIIGVQNKLEIKVEDIARSIETINYEVTTKISALLTRIIK